jgi:hypothetical protein
MGTPGRALVKFLMLAGFFRLVEAAAMIRDDAHAHVLLCHVPASFSTRGGWLCGAAA